MENNQLGKQITDLLGKICFLLSLNLRRIDNQRALLSILMAGDFLFSRTPHSLQPAFCLILHETMQDLRTIIPVTLLTGRMSYWAFEKGAKLQF